jgi:bifunctional DNA-binding transcriptional regulator/antitoxin component of YhaV-PrlF toxin-antitoxin module
MTGGATICRVRRKDGWLMSARGDGVLRRGCRRVAHMPEVRHAFGMITTLRVDASSRIVLSRDVRRAAGISAGQKLKVSAVPGRIVLETEASSHGKIAKRGKLKVWTGTVPDTPLAEAVEQARRYER